MMYGSETRPRFAPARYGSRKQTVRDAAHILDLLVKNAFPRMADTVPGRNGISGSCWIHRYKLVTLRARVKNELQHSPTEPGHAEGPVAVESKDGQKQLLELPLQFWAGIIYGRICWSC